MSLTDIVSTLELAREPFSSITGMNLEEKFYDMGQLTDPERTQLCGAGFAVPEGSILVIEPGKQARKARL
uniref:Uncharacterized protein n=1 Tax=Candidatus Kentrum sp. TUN TaxID=2126343 RepID=A0A450ZIX0_9GAMM|nr:MAG: hypothetical protein BECKTUN1418F_GA0071002_102812 [Candidatus Kentron sp. TUN]VFK61543.1 MAG: hypothetical protein BECKTUN1418E_GA0071001_10682 [Candidatus Kentron sp. TUN]